MPDLKCGVPLQDKFSDFVNSVQIMATNQDLKIFKFNFLVLLPCLIQPLLLKKSNFRLLDFF